MDDFNLVTFQQFSDIFSKLINHLLLALHHDVKIQAYPAGFYAMLSKAFPGQIKIFARIQQSLTGNAAHIETNASQAGFPFNTGNVQTELGSAHGSHVTSGSAADNNYIIGAVRCHN